MKRRIELVGGGGEEVSQQHVTCKLRFAHTGDLCDTLTQKYSSAHVLPTPTRPVSPTIRVGM